MPIPRLLVASVAFVGLLAGCRLVPDSQAEVTPQRPKFSFNTNTTAQGTVELEGGLFWDPDDLVATPATLKYGASEQAELFASWSPLNYLSLPGDDEFGIGDLFLGTRYRFWDEDAEKPSFAFQPTLKLPTASDSKGIGTGEIDALFAFMASKTAGSFFLNGFYQFEVIGDPTGGTGIGHSLAFVADHELAESLAGFAEVAIRWLPEFNINQYFTTLGVYYDVSPSLVFDTAILLGLDDAPDFVFQIGFTQNFGRVQGRS